MDQGQVQIPELFTRIAFKTEDQSPCWMVNYNLGILELGVTRANAQANVRVRSIPVPPDRPSIHCRTVLGLVKKNTRL